MNRLMWFSGILAVIVASGHYLEAGRITEQLPVEEFMGATQAPLPGRRTEERRIVNRQAAYPIPAKALLSVSLLPSEFSRVSIVSPFPSRVICFRKLLI